MPTTKQFRQILSNVLPLLTENRDKAYQEWLSGDLAKDAFKYIDSHLSYVHMILAAEDGDHSLEHLCQICAPMTTDIKAAIKDLPGQNFVLDVWFDFFGKAGFKDRHPVFDIPIKAMQI